MKKRLHFQIIAAFLLLASIVKAQQIDFTLRYNDTTDEYEVYGQSDFTQNLFFVGGGSQISIVFPANLADNPINITTVTGGFWVDNSRALMPSADPMHDFHGIASNGSIMTWASGVETLLFTFKIPGGGCLPGIRLWENGVDPPYNAPGMAGGDFDNYFADALTFNDHYRQNYANSGTTCGIAPQPPIANPDVVTTNENTALTIQVQANDSDPQNQTITTTATLIENPANGTASVINGDSILYTPNTGFVGMDTLQYAVCNTSNLCDTAFVFITINPVNDSPIAIDDSENTNEDTPITINVQTNDSDPDGDPLVTTILTNPTNGTVTVLNGDSIAYTPKLDFSGLDTFQYVICDNGSPALCDTASVVITVHPVNDPPIATDDNATTPGETAIIIDIQANDSDPDGDPLITTVLTNPTNGTVTVVNGDSIVYTPDPDFAGIDTLTYQICDNGIPALCDTARVIITVEPIFDLALIKTRAIGQRPGAAKNSQARFLIKVLNQGTADAYDIKIIDYYQNGFIFNTELNNTNQTGNANDWNADGTYTIDYIPAGGNDSVEIVLIVPENTQDTVLFNAAEITFATTIDGSTINARDVDSTPDAINDNDIYIGDNEVNNIGGDEDDHDIAPLGIYQSVDPIGYFYCDKTGAIITGGTISVTGPGVIYIIEDGFDGMYSWVTDGTPGEYVMTYNHPDAFPISFLCTPQAGAYDPTGKDGSAEDMDGDGTNNMVVLGTEAVNNGYLVDTSCANNPYYLRFDLASGDPIISGNNIPLQCNFIGAIICEDANNDGQPNMGEPGLPDIPVFLYTCTDTINPIDSTVTDSLGNYRFDGLGPGDFMVQFLPGDDHRFALEQEPLGQIEARNGYSECITLSYSDCDTTQRLCLVPCEPVSLDVADEIIINSGETAQVTVTGAGNIKWSPSIGIDCDTCSTVIITGIEDIVYTITTDDGLGCADQTTLRVKVNKEEILIEDPCNCLGNESGLNAGDGQFSERIIVTSKSGETWYIENVTGLYQNRTAPIFPPEANNGQYPLASFNTGTNGFILRENPIGNNQSQYILEGIHVDGVGYNITLSNGSRILNSTNICHVTASCLYTIIDDTTGTPGPPVVDVCAQNFVMGISNTPMIDSIKCCDKDKNTFMDDGLVDGLYQDTAARNGIFTICPQNRWQNLKYVFDQFDLARGDTLYVYDGRTITDSLLGKYSGAGVSQTGGWVATSCSPSLNESGCLTFRFTTNGDNSKGLGWNGKFECAERDIVLDPPNDLNAKLACEATYTIFTINPATVTTACGIVQDSQIVRIFNTKGALCIDTCIAFNESFPETFAIGSYLVEYKLKSDTVKTTQAVLSVQAPSLVCNDEITVPLGSACSIQLSPDDLLENPCDTITDTMYYFITLEYLDENGKAQTVSGGGKGGNYPMLNKEMLGDCGGTIKATIERRYFENLTLNICNNGQVSASCEVVVNTLDQSPPIISGTNAIDTFITCNLDLTQDGLGLPTPTAIDNCSEPRVTFEGATIINQGSEVCDTSRAEITWKAVDECGNETTLTQMVVFIRPSLEDIVKTGKITLSCENDINTDAITAVPGIKIGKLKNGVLIPSDTLDLSTEIYTCGYILQKRDIVVPATDCGSKVYRYWSVVDWCDSNSGVNPIDTTFIEYRDTTAPQFIAGTGENTDIELDHFSCTYDITKVTKPLAEDNCSVPTVRLSKVSRIENGVEWVLDAANWISLDCDSFKLEWIAEDDCHEQLVNDTLIQIIEIKDVTKPSAVCTDKINLSLGRSEARLHYTEIDAGSFDACGIAKYEVSRDEENWDSVVTFTCNDTHEEVTIYLRVTDAKGNQNTCWTIVNVEDKIRPICSDLPDMTGSSRCVGTGSDQGHGSGLLTTDVDGDQQMEATEWVDLTPEQAADFNAKYGNPNCSDNVDCGALVIQQQYQYIEKGCGLATIKRRYRATDWDGEGLSSNWAEQTISIESKADWSFTLPADWKGNCGAGIPDSELELTNGACDLLAYEVKENTFTIVEDACLKVIRTYTIINWCTYQAGEKAVQITRPENEHGMVTEPITITSEGYENTGKLEYIQILKVQDDSAPIITVDEVDTCLGDTDCGGSKQFSISASKDCAEAAAQDLIYSWTFRANGQEIATGQGASFEAAVEPKVNYAVEWTVQDNCGNHTSEVVNYEFWDCKKPSPYCLHGIAVELMSDAGMIQVWAKDMELNSTDNCTPKDKLDFRIWHANLGDEPANLDAVLALPKVITFDCSTLGTQTVNLYVIDEEDNWDFCITYVNVQDNMGECQHIENPEGMALLSGTISDWRENTVEDVEVKVSNTYVRMTKADGQYNFELAMHEDYIISPEKDRQPLNGVSTFDLVLISKHILGITSFDNPYQMIAADVNSSGTITAFDMVQIRQLILNINTEFTNSPSWKFVYADYEFITENPVAEPYPEIARITDLSTDMEMDFVAIKMGDVNGSAQTNSLIQAEERTNPAVFEILVEEMDLKAGQSYSIDFTTKQLAAIQGYQFTLAYDQLKVEQLKSGIAGVEHFGLHKMNDGFITTSWNQSTTAHKLTSDATIGLFSIEFTALHDGKLSDQLKLMNRPTLIEAYDENEQIMDIKLSFTVPTYKDKFELYQNTPNPFNDRTQIGFYLPDNSDIQLILRDETGRIIHILKDNRPKGYNTINLDNKQLTNRFIYYQLITKFGTKSKKMISIQ